MRLEIALLMLPGLLIGLTVHEFAHAWSASLLGDHFARRQGRVSLNPFRHLSLLGTLAIFLLPMGWAKPVPVNLYNFKRPRRDYLLTSLAGPAANALLVGLCLLAMLWTRRSYSLGPRGEPFLVLGDLLLRLFALINTILAAVNLIPIPPLDGSKIWPVVFPGVDPAFGKKLMRVSLFVLVALLVTGSLDPALRFVTSGVLTWMPETDESLFQDRAAEAARAMHAERYGDAAAACTEALALNPRSFYARYTRACALMRMEKYSDALPDLDRALEGKPDDAEIYLDRATVEEELGMLPRARADREHALRLGYVPGATRPTTRP